jgi:hypothetical protein
LILDIADMICSAAVQNEVTMLAYIFWHAPYVDIDVLEYEKALLGFHADLMADPPAGLEASATYQISEVPWLNGLPGYEDWCFMTSSAALDALNNAAVRPERWNVHAAVSSKTDFRTWWSLLRPARGGETNCRLAGNLVEAASGYTI